MNIIFHTNSPVLTFAADQLRRYLTRMAGDSSGTILPASVTLEVRDVIPEIMGHDEASAKSKNEWIYDPSLDDAYVVEIHQDMSYIAGENERSVLLGVYGYLTEIGCRFLKPGAEYEVVPILTEREDFYASLHRKASMRHRGICIEGADSIENILDTIDWLPKVGYNSFFLQFKYPHEFMRRWYEHVKNPSLATASWSLEESIAADGIFHEAMKKRGLLQHRVGHGWTGEVLGSQEMGWELGEDIDPSLVPLMAEINGERKLIQGRPTFTNLCYTKEEAVDRFAAVVVNYAKSHPEVDYLHVWLADLPNHVCECENCRKLTLTDQYVHLLNVIDERMTLEGLPTRIVFLLYQELCFPPETAVLKNPDRFVLMFAPITRTFLKSYQEAEELAPIPDYVPNHIVQPHTMEENLAYLKAWQEKVQCDSFVYDYHLGKAHYGDPGYVHLSRIIAEDLKTNKHLGLNGYNSCQELRAGFPNGLPNYVMGQLGMDVSREFDEVAADYYWAAYGERWAEALDYLSELSDLYEIDYFVGYREALDPLMAERFHKAIEVVQDFEPIIAGEIDKFRQEHSDIAKLHLRFWKELAAHSTYVTLLSATLENRAMGEDSREAYAAFAAYVRDNELILQKALDVYRVLEVTENYTRLREA